MVRLQKYKKFFIKGYENYHNGYSYEQVQEEIREFIKTNNGSLDAIVAKTSLCSSFIIEGEFKEAEKILSSLEFTGNELVDYFIYNVSSFYYGGINDPNLDSKKSDEFHNQAKKLSEKIVFQDNWEEGLIKSSELNRVFFLEHQNKSERLELANKYLELFQTNHALGYYLDSYIVVAGAAFSSIGKYNRAIKIFKHSYETFAKSDLSLLHLHNLLVTYLVINELEQAKKYLALALQKANQSTNYWLKQIILEVENFLLSHEQRYEDLENNLVNQVELARDHKNDLKTSYKELDIFRFYINRFKSTENNEFLVKAKKTKERLQILTDNSDDIRINRRNDHAKAILLSLGSLKQKAKGVEIYEDLIKIYPYYASLKLELIDLYWDDLKYDVDGESKKQIDQLLAQLESYANVQQNDPDNSQISIQILLAKYDFYINQNKDKAIDTLYVIQTKAHSDGKKLLEEKVTNEIKLLENDLNWNSSKYTVKERIENFKSYIEGAKVFLEHDL